MNIIDLDKIIVIGGGNAGLISALILKTTFSNKLIHVIKPEKTEIIEAGESTTEHISSFMRHVGISHEDLIKHCGATLKAGVYFQGFSPDDFMHHVSFPYTYKRNDYYLMYGQLIGYKQRKVNLYPEFFNYAEIPVNIFDTDQSPINQYHIDTFKFNKYLLKLCKERGVSVYEEEIKDIILNDKGDVEKIISNNILSPHKADLFVDCTGFKRLLAKRLNFEWVSYKKYLPLNSSVAFSTDEMEEYNLFTLAKTMKSGWLWRIPIQARTRNGYVFNKDFTSLNEIEKEIQSLYKEETKIERSFEFEPGYYKEMWKNNVVVAGSAGNFIEPLETTSIGSVIQQMFILIHFLPANDRKSNNKQYTYLMENIFNFVALHYQVKKDDSNFWKHVQDDVPVTDFLKEYLPIWKKRLPQDGDFLGNWNMFTGANFINVLFGLDLLDLKAIIKECRLHPFVERFNVTKRFRRQRNWEAQCLKTSHKAYINLLKNNKDKELRDKNEIY